MFEIGFFATEAGKKMEKRRVKRKKGFDAERNELQANHCLK